MLRIVGALLLAASPAWAVGFEEVRAPDPGHPAIEAGIWYPSDAPVSAQTLELSRQVVAPEGGVTAGPLR